LNLPKEGEYISFLKQLVWHLLLLYLFSSHMLMTEGCPEGRFDMCIQFDSPSATCFAASMLLVECAGYNNTNVLLKSMSTRQSKTRQQKTIKHKTQDNARQQHNTTQEKAGQGKTTKHKRIQDKTTQDNTIPEEEGQENPRQD
jgi:hypothetical protein